MISINALMKEVLEFAPKAVIEEDKEGLLVIRLGLTAIQVDDEDMYAADVSE
jgi:hypothetical protein